MYPTRLNQSGGAQSRYSAKNNLRPHNFFCNAPDAQEVFLVGDFNDWQVAQTPLARQPDGGWHVQVPLHHGHHRYLFLVDGVATLDPRAQGVTRNERNERVSMIAIS